jgi:acyl-CoA synthetase (NDP forming)
VKALGRKSVGTTRILHKGVQLDQVKSTDSRQHNDFSRLFNPRNVAVIGASSNLSRIGGQPLKLLTEYGYKGQVYPVNPKYDEIKGLKCYHDVASVPKPCDVALIALSAHHVGAAVEECGAAGIPFAIVFSSGFSEVGDAGKALQQQLSATARASGVRVIGPNCLGVLNVKEHVRNGFGGVLRQTDFIPGPFAMVTQSGGFGFGLLSTAAYYGVGFNYASTTGNEADISTLDLVEYFLESDDVEGVFLFMEGVGDGRRLMALGERALQLAKPILVWKVGNSDVGRQAAASHSARMVAGYELYQAAFRRGGFIEINDAEELIDTLKLLRIYGRQLPSSRRTAIVTPSGGAGVLLADLCSKYGLDLPQFSATTTAELRTFMAAFASVANPVDITAAGNNDNNASFNRVVSTVLADPNIDQVIVRTPSASGTEVAKGMAEISRASAKPILLDWPISPGENTELLRLYEDNGIPCIVTPGRTVRALAALNSFAEKLRHFRKRSMAITSRVISKQSLALPLRAGTLGEHHSKQLLRAYGIPVVADTLLAAEDVAGLTSAPLPFPMAVKIDSPDIPHKTEAGVVRLNIRDLAELKMATSEILAAAKRHDQSARIEGISLQEMATGLEVIVGAVNDPHFGPVIVFGLGGIYTELLKDITHGFAPFDIGYARQMIESIRGIALLHGFRGQPALDVDALADTLSRLSLLAADHADRIAEIDINPIFVRPAGRGVVAADALFLLK